MWGKKLKKYQKNNKTKNSRRKKQNWKQVQRGTSSRMKNKISVDSWWNTWLTEPHWSQGSCAKRKRSFAVSCVVCFLLCVCWVVSVIGLFLVCLVFLQNLETWDFTTVWRVEEKCRNHSGACNKRILSCSQAVGQCDLILFGSSGRMGLKKNMRKMFSNWGDVHCANDFFSSLLLLVLCCCRILWFVVVCCCFVPQTALELNGVLNSSKKQVCSIVLSGFWSRRCGVVVLPMAFRPDADS